MKHFKLKTHPDDRANKSPILLFFPNLQSLEIEVENERKFSRYIKFFQNHRHLTRLALESPVSMLNKVAAEFPNFNEITSASGPLSIEHIERLIENHEHLKKIQFSIRWCNRELLQMYRDRFKIDYHIDEIEWSLFNGYSDHNRYLVLEKRTLNSNESNENIN